MSKNTEEYLKLTQNWQDIIIKGNHIEISNHMNSGFSFHITREEYEIMKKNNPKYVHYYFGVEDGNFKILIIDDVADKDGEHKSVFKRNFENELVDIDPKNIPKLLEQLEGNIKSIESGELNEKDNTITPIEALNRSFRWKLFSSNWLKHKIQHMAKMKSGIFFPLIKNPIEDLDDIFKSPDSSNYAHHFFGLKLLKQKDSTVKNEDGTIQYPVDKMDNYMIDIIVTNITDMDYPEYFGDRSVICHEDYDKTYSGKKYSLLPNKI